MIEQNNQKGHPWFPKHALKKRAYLQMTSPGVPSDSRQNDVLRAGLSGPNAWTLKMPAIANLNMHANLPCQPESNGDQMKPWATARRGSDWRQFSVTPSVTGGSVSTRFLPHPKYRTTRFLERKGGGGEGGLWGVEGLGGGGGRFVGKLGEGAGRFVGGGGVGSRYCQLEGRIGLGGGDWGLWAGVGGFCPCSPQTNRPRK